MGGIVVIGVFRESTAARSDDVPRKQADAALHVAAPHPYRRDIDGLRAVAVLPILFNHAGVRGFGGGYIGVDIFFVISGYLITGILLRDMAEKRHSIAEFYRRRALRIFPALFVMLAAVTVIVPAATLPDETLRYARSLGASTLFASNILFYTESGYFDVASHVKPLLHTWSLAIEEQFYILWPLVLSLLGGRRRAALKPVLIMILLASLGASIWLVRNDMTAAFYLLPSRAWELALGGLLVCFPRRWRNRSVDEVLSIGAIGALALGFWRYSNLTPFPGTAALLPCLSTAMLIFTGPSTLAGRCLSFRPVTFFGWISYSLYLWHWPVIVFAETWLLLSPSPAVIAGEIAVSLLVATLSWRFVETPFRIGGRRWTTRSVLAGSAMTMAVSLATAGLLIASSGLPGRFTPRQIAIARYADGGYEAAFRPGTCFVLTAFDRLSPRCLTPSGGRPTVLLVGDSYAAHLWPGLSGLRDRYDVLQATVVGCRPGIYTTHSDGQCERFYRSILSHWLPDHRPDLLILSGRWQTMDLPTIEPELAALHRQHIDTLLIGPMPDYAVVLPRLLVIADQRNDPTLPGRSLTAQPFEMDRALRTMAERYGIHYASPIAKLCRGHDCRTFASPGVPLQFDYGHLTPAGSAVMAGLLQPDIAAALAGRPSMAVEPPASLSASSPQAAPLFGRQISGG